MSKSIPDAAVHNSVAGTSRSLAYKSRCLQAGTGISGSARVFLAECSEALDSANQLWFQNNGKFKNVQTSMCMDVDSNSQKMLSGSLLVQKNCEETLNGQWEIELTTGKLVNVHSKSLWGAKKPMCADVLQTEDIHHRRN